MFRFPSLLAASAAILVAIPAAAQDAAIQLQGPAADVRIALAPAPAVTAIATPAQAREVVAPPVGPTVASGIAGVRVQADAEVLAPAVAAERVGKNPALMIVGGAALLVGAIIGGDAGTIVMVGGAALGLIGLWNFLR